MSSFDINKKPLIGVVHLPPLIKFIEESGTIEELYSISFDDAQILEKAGFDAIILENFFDTPFTKYKIDDARFLIMSLILEKIKSKIKIPFGINILRNACVQALIMATIVGASFIRCNIWEGTYITDQGLIEGVATQVHRKSREMHSNIKVLADVHVKHATPLGNFTLIESALNALNRQRADSIIITGRETGKLVNISKLRRLVAETNIKPFLGSGLSIDNLDKVFPYIGGAIVGSSIKKGNISSPIDPKKAQALMNQWDLKRKMQKQ